MDLDEKFINLHASLMTLAHDDAFIDRDKPSRLKAILKQCAKQLNVSRVSIWAINSASDRIQCELLYTSNNNCYEAGAVLLKNDYPSYFKGISENKIINANDAPKNVNTMEFTDSYLAPLDIKSMLDVPIFFRGKLYGVLCIEQTQLARVWDIAEMSYAASVADTISLINEYEYWLKTREKLEIIDRSDSLTHLENRRYFQQRIEADWGKNKEVSRTRALVMLGLDDFTKVNDTYGSTTSDKILQSLSERFQQLSQKQFCYISRLGGDTFGFWLPEIKTKAQLEGLVNQLTKQVKEPFQFSQGESIEVEGSLGVYIYTDAHMEVNSAIRYAEVAMERSKKERRGSVSYFSTDWLAQIEENRIREKEILELFDNKQLTAHYQPISSADTLEIIGVEALVRWQHPTRGLLPPSHFLPLIAELGLLSRLGKFMMRQACHDLSALLKEGVDLKWVSINLAAEQLYDSGLVSEIEVLLDEFDLTSSSIELEIVEELISQDSEMVRSQLLALSNIGVNLSIDDFGTGFSSLSRLKNLPVSKLKIDKSFVDGLPDSADDQCIALSIIGLAKGMNLSLVAEGVETKPQSDWLIKHRCDYIQGYFYSKPVSFDVLKSMFIRK